MDRSSHRLPEHVRPTRYEPHLTVAIDEDTFEGEVAIELDIQQATDAIELHARGLEPIEIGLEAGDKSYEPSLTRDPDRDRWRLELDEPIGPGPARLEVAYEGQVGPGMTGLYRSQAGSDVCLVTQCEPTDARAVFPCFDEPSFKAEIAWRVTADEELTVLANGEIDRVEEAGGGQSTRVFEATPPIASYLAAIAVGDFHVTDAIEQRGVPFRVYSLSENVELGEHAQRTAARLVDWYEDYFHHPYPYAKYDQVAVPSFSFGAMENVGLVVFRSSLLLLDPDRATWDEHKAVDRVVAHEFAHMWFGNLVTMEWWDDLWLNEAFAEWIAHEAVDQLVPEHEVWHAFRARTDQALDTDGLDATHAIYHPVDTPAEAMEMFDAITYGKGSAVMRMLEAYLGPETFREGLRTYIQANVEDNATGSELWQHLSQAAEEPVADVMEAWITQPGHPCIEIELTGEQDGQATVELAQQRHRSLPSAEPGDRTWPVPVVLRYADDTGIHEERLLLEDARREVSVDVDGELAWLVGNADQGGFYRVAPGEDLEARLVEHVDELTPAERAGLLRDSLSLVEAGERSMEAHLELLEASATGQAHFAFVDDVVSHLRKLERWLEGHGDEEALAGLRAWVGARFRGAFAELGGAPDPGEQPARRHRRASVFSAMGGIAGDKQAIAAALETVDREQSDPDAVDPDQATAAVNVAARQGDVDRFDRFWRTYQARLEEDRPPQQVQRYLHSLPLFRDGAAIDELLDRIDANRVPKQSIGPLLERLLHEPHAQEAALAYVEAHHREIVDRIGHAWIARIVEATGEVGPGLADRARGFLSGPVAELAPESTKRALERIQRGEELAESGAVDALADWARQHA